jgi:hypothetical protein
MTASDYAAGVGRLREQLAPFRQSPIFRDVVGPKDAVLARFQPIFSASHASEITVEEMLSFLPLDNNRHWTGLHRQGTRMVSDIAKLRRALGILLDEARPVSDRFDTATELVFGMGKNAATAILMVAYPDRYGVWNNRSEAVLRRFGLWPEFDWGMSRGEKYARVNSLLLRLAADLDVDLWTLDALWWYLDEGQIDDPSEEIEVEQTGKGRLDRLPESLETQSFGLERHLHAFLRDNWNSLDLAKDWEVYSESGEEAGVEYPTDIGRIDILARRKDQSGWLVIELKREQSADTTVGQVLRYMGWVRRHLADSDQTVSGLIISRTSDRALPYALSMIPGIDLRTYDVKFTLRPAEHSL